MHTTTHMAGRAQRAGAAGIDLRGLVFERVMERVHRYFARLVRDPHGVDDCVQRTLLRLETSLREGTYDPQRSFNRWMWMKAHSVFVDYCREKGRAPMGLEGEAGMASPDGPTGEAVEARLDAGSLLDRLRAELPPESLEMFVLRYAEWKSVSEVAAVTGRDRKTVRKRLEAAERIARRLLGERAEEAA